MQLASKPVASHEHIIFSLKEYKVSLREPWLLWATFLFRLSVPIIGKPQIGGKCSLSPILPVKFLKRFVPFLLAQGGEEIEMVFGH
jgi:hypothetical protein